MPLGWGRPCPVPNHVVAIAALLPMGAAWIAVLSTLKRAVCRCSSRHGCGPVALPWSQLSIFGSMAGGGVIWGVVAQWAATWTFVGAAVLARAQRRHRDCGRCATSRAWTGRRPCWLEPQLLIEPEEIPARYLCRRSSA